MREIKFRAWVPRDKEMFHVRSILFDKGLVALIYDEDDEDAFFERYNDIVLMQYSDVYDMHGVRICEGDIIKFKNHYPWENDFSIREMKFEGSMFSPTGIIKWNYEDVEVIGNVCENKDLLKEEE